MTVDLKKLIPEITVLVGLLSDQFGTQISEFVVAHPKVAMVAAVVAFIANKFVAPPVPAAPKV